MKKKIIQTSNDIGDFFKAARETANMTIEKVSLKSGYTTQTVSNLEKNRGSVNVNTLLAIATTIGVKVVMTFEEKESA